MIGLKKADRIPPTTDACNAVYSQPNQYIMVRVLLGSRGPPHFCFLSLLSAQLGSRSLPLFFLSLCLSHLLRFLHLSKSLPQDPVEIFCITKSKTVNASLKTN